MILGPIIGPALGGWLTENLSWRWVLLHQRADRHPGLRRHLRCSWRETAAARQRPFDFLGLRRAGHLRRPLPADDRPRPQPGLVRLDARSGSTRSSPPVALLGLHRPDADRRAPVLPPRPGQGPQLRRLHHASASSSARCCSPPPPCCPRFMQNLLGYSALQSGYASMPRGVGSLVAFLSVPYLIPRIGARRVLAIGLVDRGDGAVDDGPLRPADDRGADHDHRAHPGLRRRAAVRAAEHARLRHAEPDPPHRRHHRHHHGPEPGLQRRHLDDVGRR